MKSLAEVVDAINSEVSRSELRSFYEQRRAWKGNGRRYKRFFQPPKDADGPLRGYSFHHGGRKELQFNVGFEGDRFLRYGVAFSLQPSRDVPDPVAEVGPLIARFNREAQSSAVLRPLKMWRWRGGERGEEIQAGAVPPSWLESGSFIFFGERVDVASTGVTPALVQRVVALLGSLLPLYEFVHGGNGRIGGVQSKVLESAGSSPPTYVARLAFNSAGWRRPANAREVTESGNTYRSAHGFGHEDWLFRDEWQLGGWRYAFVQGVNASREKLLRRDRPFNLRLFTMPAAGARCAVAEIDEVECLDDEAAAAAVAAFDRAGWLSQMREEVREAGGNYKALDGSTYAPHVLNIRYRLECVRRLDAGKPIPKHDPIHRITRYGLYEVAGAMETARSTWRGRAGSTTLPGGAARVRRIGARHIVYSPEHIRMQEALRDRLQSIYPGCVPVFEQDFVDVMLRTSTELLLFEVKSQLNPLSVVREALGQLLEYAFHPRRQYDLPVKLVIVGRRELEGDDLLCFDALRRNFELPLEYWSLRCEGRSSG